jgi:hypothetical protein
VGYFGGPPLAGDEAHHRILHPCDENARFTVTASSVHQPTPKRRQNGNYKLTKLGLLRRRDGGGGEFGRGGARGEAPPGPAKEWVGAEASPERS